MATAAYTHNPIIDSLMGSLKTLTLVGSALMAAVLVSGGIGNQLINWKSENRLLSPVGPTTIASVPLSQIRFNDLGVIPTPHITTKFKVGSREETLRFLIDTGAKLSVAPISIAKEMNVDTSNFQRIVLQAATADTTYGYITNVDLDIDGNQINIPLAFAPVTEPLLGMHGFMDRYNVSIDAKKQVVTISK
jgi:predicted aspartyl protease